MTKEQLLEKWGIDPERLDRLDPDIQARFWETLDVVADAVAAERSRILAAVRQLPQHDRNAGEWEGYRSPLAISVMLDEVIAAIEQPT